MRFSELRLEPTLVTAIEKLNYQDCTPIQESTFVPASEGRDVAGLAQTGTGKTAAFLIPLMDRILKSRVATESLSEDAKKDLEKRAFKEWRSQNFILILVPTRELAEQVYENVLKLGEFAGLRGVSIYGGTAYEKQKEGLKNGVEFVIATPGRLIDLYKDHFVDLKQVRGVVFDEADRMFDMGFKDDMKFILSRIPRERQLLVFSATLNFDVTNTIYQFGADPVEVNVSRDQAKAENVKDAIFHCGSEEKGTYVFSLIKKYNPAQVIIFCNFKHSVEKIAKFLTLNGIPSVGISSLLTQAQRNRVMEQFKAVNEKNILVATDVAARGLDIKGVDMVINFDLPQDAESYVHRIGRTGRAGQEGRAFSLVSDRDVESLSRVQDFLKNKLSVGWLEDSELIKPERPLILNEATFERKFGSEREGRHEPRGGGRFRDRPPRAGGAHGGPGGPRGERRPFKGDRRPPPQPRHGKGPEASPEDAKTLNGSHPSQPQGAQQSRPPRRHDKSRDHRNRDQKSGDQRHPQGEAAGQSRGHGQGRHRPQNTQSRTSNNQKPLQRRPLNPPAGKGQPTKSLGSKVRGLIKKLFT